VLANHETGLDWGPPQLTALIYIFLGETVTTETTTERVSVPAARVRLLCEESAATARTAPPVRQVTPLPRLVRRNHFQRAHANGSKSYSYGQ
jgi:hypothetical protein